MGTINTGLFENSEKEFLHHISMEGNSRIIFSAPYGTGKSTFLDYYFDKRKEEFNTIRLAPVNYSVSNNEDIFKYIKYDILSQLILTGRLTFKNYDFSIKETMPYYVINNLDKVVISILKGITRVKIATIDLDPIYEEMNNLYSKVKDQNKEANATPENVSEEFSRLLGSEEGSLYEFNVVSKFISDTINIEDGKKNVLVIDDLDRIDPEHIFRLLNVFAAHNDFHLNDNGDPSLHKFGFDKIILVCDINNIRNIFHTKYGGKTDFSGYIDKFYSCRIFYFDNRNNLRSVLRQIIEKFDFVGNDYNLTDGARARVEDELNRILSAFIERDLCTLRSLLKTDRHILRSRELTFFGGRKIPSSHIISVVVIDILLRLFGERERLLQLLIACIDESETNVQLIDGSMDHIFALTQIPKHKYRTGKFQLDKHSRIISYNLKEDFDSRMRYVEYIEHQDTGIPHPGTLYDLNFFKQYSDALELMHRIGGIN